MFYLLALGSAMLYGAADFAGGLASRRAGTLPVVLISAASGLATLAILVMLLPEAHPSRQDLAWGALAGFAGAVGVALLYRGLAIGIMAVVAPTTAVCAVAIPVFVALLWGERPVPLAAAGIALGVLSIVLVSQQRAADSSQTRQVRGRGGLPVGVGTALMSGIAIGFFFLALAQTGREAGMWPLLASRSLSLVLFSGIAGAGRRSLRMPLSVLLLTTVCGAIDALANALYLLAARLGPLSIAVTLSSLYPASTVLLARLVLGERLNLWQLSGVVCALAAVVLIVSGGQHP
jgi:drug/metabolite transporter (DMT)-like permease